MITLFPYALRGIASDGEAQVCLYFYILLCFGLRHVSRADVLPVCLKKKKNGTKEIKAIRKYWRDFGKEAWEINPINLFRANWAHLWHMYVRV